MGNTGYHQLNKNNMNIANELNRLIEDINSNEIDSLKDVYLELLNLREKSKVNEEFNQWLKENNYTYCGVSYQTDDGWFLSEREVFERFEESKL